VSGVVVVVALGVAVVGTLLLLLLLLLLLQGLLRPGVHLLAVLVRGPAQLTIAPLN
jgi:hypothetical protein